MSIDMFLNTKKKLDGLDCQMKGKQQKECACPSLSPLTSALKTGKKNCWGTREIVARDWWWPWHVKPAEKLLNQCEILWKGCVG